MKKVLSVIIETVIIVIGLILSNNVNDMLWYSDIGVLQWFADTDYLFPVVLIAGIATVAMYVRNSIIGKIEEVELRERRKDVKVNWIKAD